MFGRMKAGFNTVYFAKPAVFGFAWCFALGCTRAALAALAVTPPPSVASAKVLDFCTDLTYPPEEFIKDGAQTGVEVEFGRAIAKTMEVKAEFDQTGFDGIIPALEAGKCDAALSDIGVTAERAEQVDFIQYSQAGQSIMIQSADKDKIHGIDDLAGKMVAVEVGTTNLAYLQQQNAAFQSHGLKPINILTFPEDADAANALRAGKVDAYFSDAPPVAYYVALSDGSLAIDGPQLQPIPWGIAVRKNNPTIRRAIQDSVTVLYKTGVAKQIYTKWGLEDTLLK